MGEPKKKYWVGFDLGGTKMLANIFSPSLKIIGRERCKTKGHEGVQAGLARMIEAIGAALADAKVDREELAGIGIGSPGPLDLDRGIVLDTPNLGWKNAPVKDALEKKFGCTTVVMNDVDAGVFGEYARGAAQGARCVVGVFPGTGIGGGCVYEGKIIRGATLSCMEIGHVKVLDNGPLCGCGKFGCLESVASRLAIAQAAAAAAYRGEAPYVMSVAGTDVSKIRSGVLAEAIRAGDHAVEEILRSAARHIGRAMASIVNLLAPDVVLLGGGLVAAMPDLFKEEVERHVRRNIMSSFVGTYKVAIAQLGDDATAVGAAAWAQAVVGNGKE